MDYSTPGFPVPHYLPEFAQTHVLESVMPSNHVILSHPFLLLPQSFPASGSFPMSWLFASGGLSIKASASASILPKNIQGGFPLRSTGLIFFLAKGFSRVFSSTTVWKHQFFSVQPFFMVQLLHLYMTTGKTIGLTSWSIFLWLCDCQGYSKWPYLQEWLSCI